MIAFPFILNIAPVIILGLIGLYVAFNLRWWLGFYKYEVKALGHDEVLDVGWYKDEKKLLEANRGFRVYVKYGPGQPYNELF